MRTITTTTGIAITLDGDLLAIMEALYREVLRAMQQLLPLYVFYVFSISFPP